jgi:hypothetical protein
LLEAVVVVETPTQQDQVVAVVPVDFVHLPQLWLVPQITR